MYYKTKHYTDCVRLKTYPQPEKHLQNVEQSRTPKATDKVKV